MPPITFLMQFRGQSTRLEPGVLTATAHSPSMAFVTLVDESGVHGTCHEVPGDEAHLECRLTMFDDERYEETGTISFGAGNVLRFRTLDRGMMTGSPDPRLHHGVAVWEVDSGAGAFAGASGRIVSNLLVSADGAITDHHVGVLFMREGPEGQGSPVGERTTSQSKEKHAGFGAASQEPPRCSAPP
jgi:hypothetical protein